MKFPVWLMKRFVTCCLVCVLLFHATLLVLPVLQDHMANRQDGPHAHCNVFHPSYQWVFVPDLGDNAIHQYGYDNGHLTPQTHIQLPPGEGPRHFVFHPTLPVAYSGCELLSRVQVSTEGSSGVCKATQDMQERSLMAANGHAALQQQQTWWKCIAGSWSTSSGAGQWQVSQGSAYQHIIMREGMLRQCPCCM